MSNYDFVKLNQLCLKITDGSHYSPKGINEGIPMLSVKDMLDNRFSYNDCKFISTSDYFDLVRSDCKPLVNDVVIAKDGSYLKYVFVIKTEIDQAILSSIGILRPNLKKIIPEYLKYYLQTKSVKETVAKKYVSGSALPRIILKNFGEIDVVYTDILTQQKIASILSSLDSKIELNNRINAELEAMAKTLYDYWFVKFDFPNAEGKPYKSSGGKMVWCEELKREIPEGWKVKYLIDFTSIMRGISPKYIETDGICVLNQRCIRDKAINFEQSRRHDDKSKNVESKLIKYGDVLVNSTGFGTLGRVAMVKRLEEKITTVDSHITIVRCQDENVKKLFLGYSMLTKQTEIEGLAEGSTGQTELSRVNLGQLKMIIPTLDLQLKFEHFIKPQFDNIVNNEKETQQLSSLRDWLLPMLMNGQVKVGDTSATLSTSMDEVGGLMAAEPGVRYGEKL